jgi:hypothetical protein
MLDAQIERVDSKDLLGPYLANIAQTAQMTLASLTS